MNKISVSSTATRILAGLSSAAMALALMVMPFTSGAGFSEEIESSMAGCCMTNGSR